MKLGSESTEKKNDRGEAERVSVSLESLEDYEFRVRFSPAPIPELVIDESPPVGRDKGPNPSALLAAAVGGCLSASFLFCARKMRVDIQGLETEVKVIPTRNEHGRLRIGGMEVELSPRLGVVDDQKLQRCAELYEDFCVVTQSVRNGIDVSVKLKS